MSITSLTYGSSSPAHPNSWKKDGTQDDFIVLKNIVLQCTDVKSNHNKFYSLELQENKNKEHRLFSHYGRTDDLTTKGQSAGARECRYEQIHLLEKEYGRIVSSKKKKGYQEVNLASSKIGSHKAIGKTAGIIDDKTIKAAEIKKTKKTKSSLHPSIVGLVENIYSHAGQELTKKVNVSITAKGFETPLGILTIGQVENGADILSEIRSSLKGKKKNIEDFSSKYYSTIPHRLGRNASDLKAAILDTEDKLTSAEELLQLMKDMLAVNKAGGTNLFALSEVEAKYQALQTELSPYDDKEIKEYFISSQSQHHPYRLTVKNIFNVARLDEKTSFNPKNIGNVQNLFHGTKRQNIVGIMNRGLLLPRQVRNMGVSTNGAMFGNGIYSSCHSTKSANYCYLDYSNSSFYMFVLNVALGKIKSYETAQPHLTEPPSGYDSVKGVASVSRYTSGKLIHDEYMIYNTNQQKLAYCIEFTAKGK